MTNEQDLLGQIDALVASKTFNLDALEGIKAIKDSLAKVIAERDVLKRDLDRANDMYQKERQQSEKNFARIESMQTELNGMREVVKLGQDAIWEKKIAEATAGAYQDAMYTIFKPAAVRETVHRNVVKPVEGNPGGSGTYPTAGYLANATENETKTVESI